MYIIYTHGCRQTSDWPELKDPFASSGLMLSSSPFFLLAHDGLAEIREGPLTRSAPSGRPDNGLCPVKDIEPQSLKK